MYGYKLRAWVTPTGTIVHCLLQPANLHATTALYELNRRWPDFGGPKIIGDKGCCSLGFIFPPKKNTRYDTGWRDDRHPKLRKWLETVLSQLVEAQIRSVQTKTLPLFRFRVFLASVPDTFSQVVAGSSKSSIRVNIPLAS